jgi:transcription elongation factor GreA
MAPNNTSNDDIPNKKKQIVLTNEGKAELQDELEQLQEEKRPKTVARLKRAREEGDLRENSDYHNAKEDLELIDNRIDEILVILENAKVVKKTTGNGKVGVGSRVKVHLKSKKKKHRTFQIVGDFEADPSEGKISSSSPIGKALMGTEVDDEVTVETPGGEKVYVVEDIS